MTDHLLFLFIAVAYPVYGALFWYWRVRPRLAANEPGALVRAYCHAIIELWLLTAVVLSWWVNAERPIATLGLGVPGGLRFWIGAVVAVAAVAFLWLQLVQVRASAEARAQVRKQLDGGAGLIVPRGARERRLSVALSLTAGFCEEVLYRAFFLWYLMTWLPGMVAVGISALVFGVAHLYQGRAGVIKSTLAGAVFGAAYLLTGSLWVPIVLHAAVDVTGLLMSSIAIENPDSTGDAPGPPGATMKGA